MSETPKDAPGPAPFYKHVIKGKCEIHGETWIECEHPAADCTEAQLVTTCLKCRYASTQEANK